MPVPPNRRTSVDSACQNFSKQCATCSASMPMPSSLMRTRTRVVSDLGVHA